MQIYLRNGQQSRLKRKLLNAQQNKNGKEGLYASIKEVEEFVLEPEKKDGRLQEERHALSQADNTKKNRDSAARFVWAYNSDWKKAMIWGHVPAHQTGHDKDAYDKLIEEAAAVKDEQFLEENRWSSEMAEIEQKARKDNNKEEKVEKKTFAEIIQEIYDGYSEAAENESALKEAFEDDVKKALEGKPMSNRKEAEVKRMPGDSQARQWALELNENLEKEAGKNGQHEATKTPEEKTEGVSLQQAVQQAEPKKQQALDISQKMADHKQAVETKKTNREKLKDAMIAAKTGKTEETKTAGQESKNVAGPSIPPGLPINGDRGR